MDLEKQHVSHFTTLFRRGEAAGFSYFFTELYPPLRFYAFRILKDEAFAEDIVEDSFIKIWERHAQFSHHNVIKSWLYSTVRNACLTHFDKERRQRSAEAQFVMTLDDVYVPNAANEMIRAEVVADMYATIESLPPSCRTIFQMLYIDGKSVREIAKDLHLSISTIKNQRWLGIRHLRKKFPDFAFD
jgi:RNA polymerase sigma-70 factor (ECF subfamily)